MNSEKQSTNLQMTLREVNRVGEGKKNVPKLRFKGYEDAWEQRKLGDIAISFSGGTPKVGESSFYGGDIPFIRSGEIGSYRTELTLSLEGLNNSSASLVNQGDILYALYGATSGEVEISKINGAINQAILAIKPHDDFNSYTIVQWLKKEKENIISTYLQGGQGNLSGAIIKNLDLVLPSKKEEQELIGKYFKMIDNLITLHQRKYDALKKMKKTLLSKMFPKDGEDVPEIRFKGFTDAWEQRKLKEIGEIQTGNTPPTTDSQNYSEDGMLWVTPTDIEELVITKTAKRISEFGKKKARIASKGSILVTCIASIGKNTLLSEDAAFNQQINSISPNGEYDSYFLLTQSFKISEKMANSAAAATMQIVNKSQFSNLDTILPIYTEQVEIGRLFLYFDNIITLHQRKLEELKNMKKTLLQQMFV